MKWDINVNIANIEIAPYHGRNNIAIVNEFSLPKSDTTSWN